MFPYAWRKHAASSPGPCSLCANRPHAHAHKHVLICWATLNTDERIFEHTFTHTCTCARPHIYLCLEVPTPSHNHIHVQKTSRVDGEIAATFNSANSPSSNGSRRENLKGRLPLSNNVDEDRFEFVMRARLVKNANLRSMFSRSLFEPLVQLVRSACAVGHGDMM